MPKREPHPSRLCAFLQARGIDRREAVRNGTFKTLVGDWVAERRIAIKLKQVAGVAARVQSSTPKPMTPEAIKSQFANMRPGTPEAAAFYKANRSILLR